MRGLYRGDPLSPLLFVIGMEYLSRILRRVEGSYGFHPWCRRIKLSHLCFADDLMLFCKGDVSSVRTLHQCIHSFSQASRLHANASKSAIYIIGVAPYIRSANGDLTHFSFGTLPFRYLGVPLSFKCLSIVECEKLADKMTSRIQSWQAKYLSYAARLQLINFFGTIDSHKPGMVNWKMVCKPKKVGGVGIRNLCIWNQSAMGKIVWYIYMMKASLWVRWVHGVYTKGGNWEIFNAPSRLVGDVYSIKAVYLETFKSTPKGKWKFVVWNRMSIPRHRFCCWLMALNKLKTKDKLQLWV
ncbi:uncharacterized protein LOC130813502 [Amaranthus tricolor]|uniref:uncharacterized protein LOC130813502 n=1 Tax=Amaranthus tricolor TaxID=29722 RepID=UPI0025868282|nr:uncharacterized protein LOC130813502 [Amaranthus tricolor]